MVDDAHGIGVLGRGGRGTLEHFGLDARQVPILMGTLGKAFGTFGAFVAGAEDLIEFLIQRGANLYLYDRVACPRSRRATRVALRLIDEESLATRATVSPTSRAFAARRRRRASS